MEIFISLILGIPLGILASLIAWWILFHAVVPKIEFSHDISKSTAIDSKSGYRYRIKFENTGKRDVLDLEIFARYRIQGIKQETPKNWSIIDLHISKERIPIVKKGGNKIIRIYPEKTKHFENDMYPDEIQYKKMKLSLTLEDIFKATDNTSLQIVMFGYDSFSGSRKVFESKKYYIKNIKQGLFNKNNLSINIENST